MPNLSIVELASRLDGPNSERWNVPDDLGHQGDEFEAEFNKLAKTEEPLTGDELTAKQKEDFLRMQEAYDTVTCPRCGAQFLA